MDFDLDSHLVSKFKFADILSLIILIWVSCFTYYFLFGLEVEQLGIVTYLRFLFIFLTYVVTTYFATTTSCMRRKDLFFYSQREVFHDSLILSGLIFVLSIVLIIVYKFMGLIQLLHKIFGIDTESPSAFGYTIILAYAALYLTFILGRYFTNDKYTFKKGERVYKEYRKLGILDRMSSGKMTTTEAKSALEILDSQEFTSPDEIYNKKR